MSEDKKKKIDRAMIVDLAEILSASGLSEIEIETEDHRIRLVRGVAPAAASAPAPVVNVAPTPAAPAPAAAPPPAAPEEETGTFVRSPIVGTVYLSPDPESAPFVKPGDKVEKGQSLLIVEAMKTMNHIPAPQSGIVREVLVTDGQPVEFDEPLVRME